MNYLKVLDAETSMQFVNNPYVNKAYTAKIFIDSIKNRPLIVTSEGSLIIKHVAKNEYSLIFSDTLASFLIFSIDCSKCPAYQLTRTFSDSTKYESTIYVFKQVMQIGTLEFKPKLQNK